MKIKEAVHEILRSTWNRDISADDAAEEIESLFFDVGEMTETPGQGRTPRGWYVAIDEMMIDEFEDGQKVFIMAND